MTTVGVAADQPWRVDALRFPDYNYHRHHFKTKQLCDLYAVETARDLPLFRRADADFQRRNCQSYVCQNTTRPGETKRDMDIMAGGQASLKPLPITPAPPRPDLFVRARIGPKEYARWRQDTTPVETTQTHAHWSHFLSRSLERYDIGLPLQEQDCQPYFDGGYALRYLHPFSTRRVGLEPRYLASLCEIPMPAVPSPYRPLVACTALTNGHPFY